MILVLARTYAEFKRFLKNNNLSEIKYVYVYRLEQLYCKKRGSILLMFESYKANENYHELIKLARHRNMDCIQVK